VSKEHVLQEIHAEYAVEMVAGAREVMADTALTLSSSCAASLPVRFIALGPPSSARAVFYQGVPILSGKEYANIRKLHDEQESVLFQIIERAQAAGELRADVDPQLLIFSISGITAWIYTWYDPKGKRSLEDIADSIADIILDGVVAK